MAAEEAIAVFLSEFDRKEGASKETEDSRGHVPISSCRGADGPPLLIRLLAI